ncbi:MAG: hypothetical protein KAI64_03320, partial [Thermoplasmata archaeon]|nr:hypothetical protein [Thermoplasmata archaeon]
MKSVFLLIVLMMFVSLPSVAQTEVASESRIGSQELEAVTIPGADLENEGSSFTLGIEISGVRGKEMEEKNGLRPQFPLYRIESDRYFVVGTYSPAERISLKAGLGLADLVIHSDEGEEISFDNEFAWMLGVEGVLYQEAERGVTISGGILYLDFEVEDETTVSIPKTLYNGGDQSIQWNEWELYIKGQKSFDGFDGYVGIKYNDIDADRKRAFAATTLTSSFDSEENIG